jgi:hypothetical protein
MSATPIRPGDNVEPDELTKSILDECLRTADEDAKSAADAKQAIAKMRRNLKRPTPH